MKKTGSEIAAEMNSGLQKLSAAFDQGSNRKRTRNELAADLAEKLRALSAMFGRANRNGTARRSARARISGPFGFAGISRPIVMTHVPRSGA